MFVLFVLKYLFVFYSKHQFLHWFSLFDCQRSVFAYVSVSWSVWMDSNHRPRAYQARALTTWATDRFLTHLVFRSTICRFPDWWRWRESNPWPPACRAGALPAELHPHIGFFIGPWQLNNRCLYTAQYASNPVLRLWPWMSLRFFVFVLYLWTTVIPLYSVLCWPRSP